MNKPTGKLKFAYATIVTLEQQKKELVKVCSLALSLVADSKDGSPHLTAELKRVIKFGG